MEYSGKTDKGRTRSSNQDCFTAALYGEDTAFFLVCDGMGGANGGEEASRIAQTTACSSIESDLAVILADEKLDKNKYLPKILSYAAQNANLAVYDRAAEEPMFAGMGTTFVAAVICGRMMYVVNVGDSRLYLITDSEVKQITRDHSYVQYLVDMGVMTSEQAQTSSRRNIITKAIGTDETVDPDIFTVTLEGECYVLLCSDGLSNMLDKAELLRIVRSRGTLDKKTDALIKRANELGGPDNITAVLVKV